MRMFRNWLRPTNKAEADLTDELTDYVHRETERNIARGFAPEEARTIALRDIGGIEVVKEGCRDVRRFRPFEMFVQDVRYGLRQLRKHPGFTLTAALTFALGIGSNTTIFTTVNAILLRPPSVEQPGRLMVLMSQKPGVHSTQDQEGRMAVSAPDFVDWRAQAKSFSEMAASSSRDFTVGNAEGAERVAGDVVSTNYFHVLGVNPILGRSFVTGEDQVGHNAVALLSEDLWKQSFGGQRDILGRQLRIDGEAHTVIGILPESFRAGWVSEARIWLPLTFRPEERQPKARAERFLRVFARLKPGIPEAATKAELSNIEIHLEQAYSDTERGWGATLMPVQKFAQAEWNATRAVLFLQGTVLFVLLIACANVVNLLLARNSMRQREFAIRASLGAGGFRLARQLLTECLLLGAAGALGGLVFANVGLKLIRSRFNWNDVAAHMAESLTIDGRVLLFTCAVSILASLVAGLAPVFQIQRAKPASALKESSRNATGGRQHQRLQKLLVVGELVLSMVLLTGAGLFVANFMQGLNADAGFNPHNVLTASISLSGQQYKTASQQIGFFQNVLNETSHSPEVVSSGITSAPPFTFPEAARIATAEQDLTQPAKQLKWDRSL